MTIYVLKIAHDIKLHPIFQNDWRYFYFEYKFNNLCQLQIKILVYSKNMYKHIKYMILLLLIIKIFFYHTYNMNNQA